MHARHRFSTDSDHVGETVSEQFEKVKLALEETLRIKAWMIVDRGATRDFLDVAALGDLLGTERAAQALAPLSELYDNVGTETATMRFAQAAMTQPVDASELDLRPYRGLTEPYNDLDYVLRRVRELAVPALERELGGPSETLPDDEAGPGKV